MRETSTPASGFFERLFRNGPTIRKFATEAEIVQGLTGCIKHRDRLSNRFIHCSACKVDRLARIREYGLSHYDTGIDIGDILTDIYSCSVCDTLTTPDKEHQYDYFQGES